MTYSDFQATLGYDAFARTFSVQMCFLLYLLLGQFVALGLWRLVARPGARPASWKGRLCFVGYLFAAQAALFLGWPRLVVLWVNADRVALADALVVVHLALVLGCLLLLALLPVAAALRWGWSRNFWLRLAHLAFIELVAGQALVGLECPLLTVERDLRGKDTVVVAPEDPASPLGRLCNRALYSPVGSPLWVLGIVYSAVGLAVLLSWLLLPPRMPWREAPELSPDQPAA